jgi:hypothetical protein
MDVPLSAARLNYSNNPAYLFAEQPDCKSKEIYVVIAIRSRNGALYIDLYRMVDHVFRTTPGKQTAY